MTGLLFMQHGTAKLLGFPAVDFFAELDTMTAISGVFELVGGALVTIGLFSRAAAFILSGMLAVAYFMVHAGQSFFPLVNQGELAVLYCFVFLYLVFAGPGPWSLDATIQREPAIA